MVSRDSHEEREQDSTEALPVVEGFRFGARARHAVWGVLSLVAVFGLFTGCRGHSSSSTPPPTVTVAKPVSQTVTDFLSFTGNTAATNSVTLVARVEGYLEKVHFADGSPVKKGD